MNHHEPIFYLQANPAQAGLLKELLQRSDYSTHPLLHYREYKSLAQKLRESEGMMGVLFVDPYQQDLAPTELLEALFKLPQSQDMVVILVTAQNRSEVVSEALEIGAQDYLIKEHMNVQDLNRSIRFGQHRLRMIAELRETNASKDKLISILAHDLRGPLTGISELSKMVLEDIDALSKEEIEGTFDMIHQSADGAFQLMQNLLEWSRLQVGSVKAQPESVLLKPAVELSLKVAQNSLQSKDLQLKMNIAEDLRLWIDPQMLQSILRNLLSNAIKFSPRSRSIFLEAKSETGSPAQVHISLRDEGIGMPPTILNKLFDVEASKGRPGTEGEKSSGFGLMLVKSFVDENQGRIWAESEEGQGSTFHLTFPALEPN